MVETKASAPNRWAILFVLCAALMVVVVDVTVLHVAAPAISADLSPTAIQLLWIIDVYPLVAAPLLLASGVAGDRLGRRKVLFWGLAVFGIASVAAAFAPSAPALIAARALLGVGGAIRRGLGTLKQTTINQQAVLGVHLQLVTRACHANNGAVMQDLWVVHG